MTFNHHHDFITPYDIKPLATMTSLPWLNLVSHGQTRNRVWPHETRLNDSLHNYHACALMITAYINQCIALKLVRHRVSLLHHWQVGTQDWGIRTLLARTAHTFTCQATVTFRKAVIWRREGRRKRREGGEGRDGREGWKIEVEDEWKGRGGRKIEVRAWKVHVI